jgi:hypothetical protein
MYIVQGTIYVALAFYKLSCEIYVYENKILKFLFISFLMFQYGNCDSACILLARQKKLISVSLLKQRLDGECRKTRDDPGQFST